MKSRTELEDLTESLARAWNAHDAAALCAFYAADADFVDVTGAITQGREAIFARHQAWFRTVFSRSSLAMNAIKVRFITPGTAACMRCGASGEPKSAGGGCPYAPG